MAFARLKRFSVAAFKRSSNGSFSGASGVRSAALLILAGIAFVVVIASGWLAYTILRADFVASLIEQAKQAPPGLKQRFEELVVFARLIQSASLFFAILLPLLSAAFCVFLLVIANQVFTADKVAFFGFKFETSDKLRDAVERRELSERKNRGLEENIQELYELNSHLNALVRLPTTENFFDCLDALVATSAFTLRPMGRALRASVWLADRKRNEARIVASYRISRQSRRAFTQALDGDGFAASVIRERAPKLKTSDLSRQARDWAHDPGSTHATDSILGQYVEIDNRWSAVLCFSTDRPEYKLSFDDTPALSYFGTLLSSVMALALTMSDEEDSHPSMLELTWARYRKEDA